MKKFVFVLLIALTFISCDVGDDVEPQFFIGPIQNVTMPTSYKVDSVSTITIRYKRNSDCYVFNGIYYAIDQNTRTVAIKFARLNEANCLPDEYTVYEVPLNFKPVSAGTYTFKFYTGQTEDGTELYTEYEALVEQ